MNFQDKLDKIEEVISREEFLTNRGGANEVGYYVFDYDPSLELRVRDHISNLIRRNPLYSQGYQIILFDLYDLMIDYIEAEDILEDCIYIEKEYGLAYLIRSVVEFLNMGKKENYLTNYIMNNTPDKAVVFITGVGKIFPFVRSHDILNELQQVFDRVPVVLFYPGKYDGQTLILFSEFKDDHYYRAFPLVENGRMK